MIGLGIYLLMCIAYVIGAFFLQKKEKSSVWNSLIFSVVVLILALILRPNLILSIPKVHDSFFYVILVFMIGFAWFVGYYGKYTKGSKVYKLNLFLIRPVVLEIGFCGVAMFCLGDLTLNMAVIMPLVIVAVTILNLVEREYRMAVKRQIIFDIIFTFFDMLLAGATLSVWPIIIPHVVYALGKWRGEKKLRSE